MATRVLCLGDSLTEGYTFQKSGEFHPYSINLQRLFDEHSGVGKVVVETAGVSGEVVVPSMTQRLDKLLKEAKQPYDWVIILGGTNDLGMGRKGEELLPHIIGLHERAKVSGSRTLALAIPQYLYELNPENEAYKNEKARVNEGLKVYSENSNKTTLFVDLWNGLPFGSLCSEERDLYWVDGLHMTPKGYDKMASIIFVTLNAQL